MARLLRRHGVDADVLLFDHELEHFHPSSDTYDLRYMEFCRPLSWGSSVRFLSTARKTVIDDLRPYDVLIGCGLAPAYCFRAGRGLDIFVPYGGDIWVEASYRLVSLQRIPSVWAAVFCQRKGIRDAKVVHMTYTNEIYEERLKNFNGGAERWLCGFPMVDQLTYSPENLQNFFDKTHWHHEFKKIRRENDIVLMSTMRHVWGGDSSDPSQKGTDRLFKGLSLFAKRHPENRIKLITLEYGKDVYKSRKLIDDLGITDCVSWFPRMLRKDLMVGLMMSDIACGEFENSWFASGVLYEALVLSKPILAFREDSLYSGRYEELYPILNAHDPEDICARIEEFTADPDKHKAMGVQGQHWYRRYVVEAALAEYMRYIKDREVGTRIVH